jgi:hypothetical protein
MKIVFAPLKKIKLKIIGKTYGAMVANIARKIH